jgi:hypothetical protein
MTQVTAPNEECDQLPVFLHIDFLKGQTLSLDFGGGDGGGTHQPSQPVPQVPFMLFLLPQRRTG